MTFIEKRLNNDNLWNVVFWLGSSLLLYLSSFFDDVNTRRIVVILTLIGMPILVKIKAPVTFTEAKDFINSEDEIITKRFPLGIWVLLSIAGGMGLAGLVVQLSGFAALTAFFFVPTMLFILKNCPISMLFHHKLYSSPEIHGLKPSERRMNWSSNRYGPGNIWYDFDRSRR